MHYDGPWADVVRAPRWPSSCWSTKPTGAIAAAPTTSLPERIGGDKNWDYRYMWVRDTSFAADAMIHLGTGRGGAGGRDWLLRRCRSDRAGPARVLQARRAVAGRASRSSTAPGYRGSRPVAVRQRRGQPDAARAASATCSTPCCATCGDGHLLDPATGRMLADLADRCCDIWLTEDSGIWELGNYRHYTISKMGCWVALDRAVQLAGWARSRPGTPTAGRARRSRIKAWVDEHCWSEAKQSYTFYAGTDDLDAATLLAGRTGFDRGERPRRARSRRARRARPRPLLYRYTGMDGEEGASSPAPSGWSRRWPRWASWTRRAR